MPPGGGVPCAGFPVRCPFARSVGRGLDPAVDVRLMITFSGNVAAPAPCVIRFGFLSCHPPSFLTGQKGSEKPAANSEARGTAKGACGPLWKPRGFKGVARDGLRFSQGNGSLLQYPFFLPERLIRAPVPKPRPRSRAGRSVANACLTHSPDVSGRFVGAACMRPVGVRRMATFLVCVRGALICRGGIYASRQGYMVMRGLRETRPYTPHCRAGVHARRTL